ncbi:uncharacterized protein BXZ73DRAFT_77140 [Epithele typhae]|uniref:uncharacterized protein n=1 Tax=Epithele typhae TaxID=378194 RepID=UPI002007B0AB|nr:uncharacterized protein BXZ73DRAFT_77140 [Epithele typhae]KAH9934046.1 hypothetical protein BXZ73DRAFT_77140 [Epithele typhae]
MTCVQPSGRSGNGRRQTRSSAEGAGGAHWRAAGAAAALHNADCRLQTAPSRTAHVSRLLSPWRGPTRSERTTVGRPCHWQRTSAAGRTAVDPHPHRPGASQHLAARNPLSSSSNDHRRPDAHLFGRPTRSPNIHRRPVHARLFGGPLRPPRIYPLNHTCSPDLQSPFTLCQRTPTIGHTHQEIRRPTYRGSLRIATPNARHLVKAGSGGRRQSFAATPSNQTYRVLAPHVDPTSSDIGSALGHPHSPDGLYASTSNTTAGVLRRGELPSPLPLYRARSCPLLQHVVRAWNRHDKTDLADLHRNRPARPPAPDFAGFAVTTPPADFIPSSIGIDAAHLLAALLDIRPFKSPFPSPNSHTFRAPSLYHAGNAQNTRALHGSQREHSFSQSTTCGSRRFDAPLAGRLRTPGRRPSPGTTEHTAGVFWAGAGQDSTDGFAHTVIGTYGHDSDGDSLPDLYTPESVSDTTDSD